MLVYLLRHGIAEDHAARSSDGERKLVPEGKAKTKDIMKMLAKMKYPAPELVISSPLIRAEETAQLALEYFAVDADYKISEALTPMSDMLNTMSLLDGVKDDYGTVMLVGHEPHLSLFGSAILGTTGQIIEMKKSSVALFELNRLDTPRIRGTLVALLPPRIGSV